VCGETFAKASVAYVEGNDGIIKFVERMYSIIKDGYVLIRNVPVYSHLYFQGLHQLLKLMLNKRYGKQIREGVCLDFDEDRILIQSQRKSGNESEGATVKRWKTFESVPLAIQAEMLVRAVWLLENWPERFVEVCSKQKLLSSAMLRDMKPAPFWYWQVVIERLYRPDRFVAEMEIREALKYMERRGIIYTEKALSRLLGVGQVFRKRRNNNYEVKIKPVLPF
jgi:hypothetical protein